MFKFLAIAVVSLASLLSIGSNAQPVKAGFCPCAVCDCSVSPGGADCCCDGGACEFCGPACVCES
jgi:hypothetical protein